ncbi:hypothetical protein AB0L53_46675 [Nonomuraea sp. NPDC052129]|uniref:hypothetical protein n=1 Tax=Nonomuraea sp. NPDC052129 TaxID=3154651 RepID=UPI0034218C83
MSLGVRWTECGAVVISVACKGPNSLIPTRASNPSSNDRALVLAMLASPLTGSRGGTAYALTRSRLSPKPSVAAQILGNEVPAFPL